MSHLAAAYSRAERRSVPIEVCLELTHRCNLRCAHCYLPDLSAPDGLATTRLLPLLDELASAGTLVLGLSGGEPLLRADWWQIARRARELDFDLHLFTNGSLLGAREAAELAALAATVHVSFYSTDEEAFDRFVRQAGAQRRVLAALEQLRIHGVRTVLTVPLMPVSVSSLPAIAALARELGGEVRSSPMITCRRDGDPGPLAHRLPWSTLVASGAVPVLGCADGPGSDDPEAPLCAAAARYACITAAGDLLACNALPGADRNVREMPFVEAWEGSPWLSEIRSLRRSDLPICGSCPALSVCGRCSAQALLEDGDLRGPSRHAGEWARVAGQVEVACLPQCSSDRA